YCSQQEKRIAKIKKCAVEEKKDDKQADRNNNFQTTDSRLKFLELTRPFIVESRGNLHLFGNLLFRFGNRALEIPATHTELHWDVARIVFAIDKRCPCLFDDFSYLLERNTSSVGGAHRNIGDRINVLAIFR